jgi:type VI secretion system ImpB/VipA family protein
LDLRAGGAQKKVGLPLDLLVAGDFSAGKEQAPLAECEKVNINKNAFDAVLADYSPCVIRCAISNPTCSLTALSAASSRKS